MIQDYLKYTLGLDCKIKPFTKKLPRYLTEGRKYKILTIDGHEYILVEYEPGAFNLPQARKQLKILQDHCDRPAIVVLPSITAYQRKVLIKMHVPFIVPSRQLYVPSLGVAFSENNLAVEKKIESLSAAAQLIVTALILGRLESGLSQTEIAQRLELSPMAVSRAVKELSSVGLVSTEQTGRSASVHANHQKKDLFESARHLMRDPVSRRSYIHAKDLPEGLHLSGASALSAQTKLSEPPFDVHAIRKGRLDIKGGHSEILQRLDPDWIVDPDNTVLVEEWRFDPKTLSEGNVVDPISLILSMQEIEDERVEMALEELETEVFR